MPHVSSVRTLEHEIVENANIHLPASLSTSRLKNHGSRTAGYLVVFFFLL